MCTSLWDEEDETSPLYHNSATTISLDLVMCDILLDENTTLFETGLIVS